MRTLLAKALKNHFITQPCAEDPEELKRLFGSAGDNNKKRKSEGCPLTICRCFLINAESLKERSGLTEVKFENTINRLTAIANPRQIERVVRGSELELPWYMIWRRKVSF